MRPRPGDLLACLAILALVMGCFARLAGEPSGLIVDGDRPSIDFAQREDPRPVGNDMTFSFLPRYLQLASALERTGRLPRWDSSGFGGRPLVGNPQGGLFYPPVWLAWWWRAPSALGWMTVGHLLWGGLGVYVLTRGLGIGRWAATVAAGCFEASPYLLAQTFEGHYPHVWAASWYPWAFWAFGQHRKGRPWGSLALPPILALTFLTGHPQECYYLLCALSLWAMGDAARAARMGTWRHAATGLVVWGGLVGLTLSLVAVELVPDMAAQEWTLRAARMSLRQASRYHLHSIHLFQLLGPGALGGPDEYFGPDNYWETVLSIGLVPLVLATIALARHPDRAAVRGWASLTLLAAIFAAGHRLGLFSVLFELVPGMNRFRVPARSLFLANLGASVLSGFGLETLLRTIEVPADWRRFEGYFRQAALIVVAGLLVIQASAGSPGPDPVPDVPRPQPRIVRFSQDLAREDGPREFRGGRAAARLLHSGLFWFALAGTGGLLALGRSGTGRRRAVAAQLLGGLALLELGLHGHALLKVAPAGRFLEPDPISTILRTAGAADPRSGPVRIRARDTLYPDIHAFANGLEKVNINDGFQLQHAADLYQTLYPLLYRVPPPEPGEPMSEPVAQFHREVRQGVLDRLNVRWLVSDHIEPEPSWPLVATGVWNGNDFAIHRNPGALPRAYVVPRAERANDDAATVLSLFRRIDPRQAVVMARDPLGDGPTDPRQPFTPAAWGHSDPDRQVLRVTTEAPGLLVIADTWMPGWTAHVDGRPTPIFRGNHAQRVIPLRQPGRHTVILRYESPGLTRGLTVTTLALLAWGAAALALARGAGILPRGVPGRSGATATSTSIRAACGATIPASAGS